MAIVLPDNITVKRDKKAEKLFLDRMRVWLESDARSPGIHASSLLDPLRAYWQTVKPKELTDHEVAMFGLGKLFHERFLPGDGSDSGHKTSEELGIEYSVDEMRDGIPRELKSTRSFFEPKEVKDVALYLEQLVIYMAAENTPIGGLDVFYMNLKDPDTKKTSPAMRSMTVEISNEELKLIQAQVKIIAGQLRGAIDSKDPSDLPLCREWKCGKSNCAWYEDCQPPGRYGEPKWDK